VFSLPLSSRSWYTHSPVPVSENSAAKIALEFQLSNRSSNRPDCVLLDYAKSAIQCFEVSCLTDINVAVKETEKLQK